MVRFPLEHPEFRRKSRFLRSPLYDAFLRLTTSCLFRIVVRIEGRSSLLRNRVRSSVVTVVLTIADGVSEPIDSIQAVRTASWGRP
jgi:hypothetical protein